MYDYNRKKLCISSKTPLKNEMEKILYCPRCLRGYLQRNESSSTTCSACNTHFPQNPTTFFYDFRSQVSNQERGLLVEQEINFYGNEIFKDFVRTNTRKRCEEAIKQLKPKNILDIGCGSGLLAERLKGVFSSYIGYEPSDIPNGMSFAFPLPTNIFLFHDEADKKLPVHDQSLDLVLFMASYDHIPNPGPVVREAWSKLEPGGNLMIVMSNYEFWVKSIFNFLGGKEFFKHDHEHFCVHSPESLTKEILRFIPDARLKEIDANDLYIPNLPKSISFLYFSYGWLVFLNGFLKFIFNSIFRFKHRGSTMILVFTK